MPQTVVYNVTGPNARVNVSSVDASTNVVNTDVQQLFAEMRKALNDSSIAVDEKSVIATDIDQMEATNGKKSFTERYLNFMQHAANHVQVFQPFVTALAQILITSAVS